MRKQMGVGIQSASIAVVGGLGLGLALGIATPAFAGDDEGCSGTMERGILVESTNPPEDNRLIGPDSSSSSRERSSSSSKSSPPAGSETTSRKSNGDARTYGRSSPDVVHGGPIVSSSDWLAAWLAWAAWWFNA